jgi:undecaprenyl-diphosphatase
MDRRIKAAIVLLLTAAIAISLAAHFFAFFPFDLKIYQGLQEENNPEFSLVMQGVSAIGETFMGILMIGAVTAFFLIRRRWLEACFTLFTASNFVITAILKVIIARPRPPYYLPNPSDTFPLIDQYGYPSGHVLFFVVFFGFIAYLAWMYQTGSVRKIIIAACGALLLLIGPSRVYLGAHWASDVLGSYMIGTLWLLFIILGFNLTVRSRNAGVEES